MGLFSLLFKLSCLYDAHSQSSIAKITGLSVLLYSADDRGGGIGQPGGVSTLPSSSELEVSPAEA